MRRPILKLFEAGLAAEKAQREALLNQIGDPIAKLGAAAVEPISLAEDDYKNFMTAINKLHKKLSIPSEHRNGKILAVTAPLKIALQSINLGVSGSDLDKLVDVLRISWGYASKWEFKTSSKKEAAESEAEKIIRFLTKEAQKVGIVLDTVGSTANLTNSLAGALESIIWRRKAPEPAK